jgi:hypothetical protein
LLFIEDKLTSKDPSFLQKLRNCVEATKEDKEEESSKDVLHYLEVVMYNGK